MNPIEEQETLVGSRIAEGMVVGLATAIGFGGPLLSLPQLIGLMMASGLLGGLIVGLHAAWSQTGEQP